MGVGIIEFGTVLIWIGAMANFEAEVHTARCPMTKKNEGSERIPLFRGPCIPICSVFCILMQSAETPARNFWMLSSTAVLRDDTGPCLPRPTMEEHLE